jgi:outer membrane protein OmpA-like peptidoglycan-associated protein
VFRQGEYARTPVAEFGRVKEYLLNNPQRLTEMLQAANPSASKEELEKEVSLFVAELTAQKKVYQEWVSGGGGEKVPKENYARVPMTDFGSIKEFILKNPDKMVDLISAQNKTVDKTSLKKEMDAYQVELTGQKDAFEKGVNYYDVDLQVDNEKIKEGMILTTNNILFDLGKSIIRSASYSELNKAALMMKANPNMVIELSAHTDAIGGYSKNLALSNDRARSAKEYLLSKGVNASRIVAKGYGETTPVADNKSESGRQLNRRVEFRILKK